MKSDSDFENLKEGTVLEGPFWPEPVRIVAIRKIGNRIRIETVGTLTQKFYPQLLSEQDYQKLSLRKEVVKDFCGNADAVFLNLEGKRIHYAYQFDPFYAVNVSQIAALPHQIEAVYNYVLKNPRIRFLLADDPGAGKTIMAGLILKELKYRGLIDRCLIIVPGHLKDQWVRELKEKFNENFTWVDRDTINSFWGRNIWQEQNQIITSMDFAKQEDVKVGLAEIKNWNMIIIDEAHKMSAYKYGDKTKKTDRYELGELLSDKTDFMIFLTATPHRGDPENFRLFLDLLEPNLFASQEILQQAIQNKENPLFLRRLKEDLKNFDGTPIFPPRYPKTIKYRLSEDEKKLYNAVTEYVENHYQKALNKDKRNVAFALMILQRRLASSIRAIRKSLERRKEKLDELYRKGQIIQEKAIIDEDILEDLPDGEREKEEEILEKLTVAETLEELKEEIQKLQDLIKIALEVEKKEVEKKLEELKKVISSEKLTANGEKLLVFTESRDTLEYLVDKIKSWGFTTTFIHGGMNLDRRIRAEHEFKDKCQIMVATEAAGEGINLQFCCLMVNYDIPWNPNRLEQRMGRVHRYGQTKEVHIYNLVASDTREGKILSKLFDKLESIREQLGSDRIFDVIGDVLPGKSLKDLIEDAIANRRTMEDILADFDRIPDQELIRKVKEATLESLATRHMDLSAILEQSRLAKENRLVPEYIEKFFLKAAEKLNLNIEKRKDGFYKIDSVPYNLRHTSYEFKNKFGEVFNEYKKFSFDKEESNKGQAEFVAPGHPLLEAVIRNIFKESSEDIEKGAVFTDPSGKFNGLIWFFEIEIKDGKGDVAGRRIYPVYQDKNNSIKPVPASILWDLKPVQYKLNSEITNLQHQKDVVINFVIENLLTNYIEELKQARIRDAEIKKKYGIRSLEQLIAESVGKLTDYETRKIKGEIIPEVHVQKEQGKKEDYEFKKQRLEKEIESEVHLLPSIPIVLSTVAVIPADLPAEVLTQAGITDDSIKTDEEIEKIGMEVAMKYEQNQGRIPEDVSQQNLGFDIKSSNQETEEIRYIEVKARASTGKIVITPNEWLMAKRLSQEYWLYVVENAKTDPQLYLIQNPVDKLKPDEEIEIVRYIIKDWKEKAEKISTGGEQICGMKE